MPSQKVITLLTMCTMFFSAEIHAELQSQAKVDSMVRLLASAKEDTAKVQILNAIAYEYPYIDPDEGIKYGLQSLTLATKLSWQAGIAKAYYAIGGNYETKSDYTHALEYEYKALRIHEASHDEPNRAMMLGNIGIIYHTQGDQDKAMEYDSLSLVMYETLNDKKGMARTLSNMANIFSSKHNYAKTLEYDLRALSLIEELGDKQLLATDLGNIGNVYADQGDFAKAMVYYFKALRLEDEIGNLSGVSRDMGNIGETYLDISKDSAQYAHPDSLIPSGPEANLNKAIDYLSRSIVLSKGIRHPDYLLAFSESLTKAYAMSGQFKNALHTYQDFIQVRDSVYNLKKNSDFAKLQLNYEYGKREEELKYQKLKEQFIYIGGIAILLIISVSIYRNFRLQKKLNALVTHEKMRSENLLLNILPEEVAEELKDKGYAEARHFDKVTVLFTDFVGFTKVADILSAQELIDELHACFKAFDEITEKYKIEKIKTIGDAYLAVGGLPVESEDHAENVVKASIDIIEFMQKRRAVKGDKTFEVRVGIHSGSVVAGIVGIKKFAYDIWGDTVNVAARMEQNSIPNRINISQSTFDLVKDKFHCTYRGEIEAKNKGKLSMYFVG